MYSSRKMKTELQLAESGGKDLSPCFGAGWLTAVAATVIIGFSVIRALVVSKYYLNGTHTMLQHQKDIIIIIVYN